MDYNPITSLESDGFSSNFGESTGLLESVLYVNADFPLLSDHLRRLQIGAQRLAITLPDPFQTLDEARKYLLGFIQESQSTSKLKVRIILEPTGEAEPRISVQCEVLSDRSRTKLISVPAPSGFNSYPGELKTTQRYRYSTWFLEAKKTGADDALLCTSDGFIIETTIGNVIGFQNGEFLLPDHSKMGIEGIFLKKLQNYFTLQSISFRRIPMPFHSILGLEGLWVVNAVRGPMIVTHVDERQISEAPYISKRLEELFKAWTDVDLSLVKNNE